MNNSLIDYQEFLSKQPISVYRLMEKQETIWAATEYGWLKMSEISGEVQELAKKIDAINRFKEFGLASRTMFSQMSDSKGYLMECHQKLLSDNEIFDCDDSFAVRRVAQLTADLLYVGVQILSEWEKKSIKNFENTKEKTVGHGKLRLNDFFWNGNDYIITNWGNVKIQDKLADFQSLLSDSAWDETNRSIFIEEYLKWAPLSDAEREKANDMCKSGKNIKTSEEVSNSIDIPSQNSDTVAIWKGFA